LKQVDLDGTFSYSPVCTVTLTDTTLTGAAVAPILYPNPAPGDAALLTGAQPGTAVTVTDALGHRAAHTTANAAGMAALALPAGQQAGVYVVRAGGKAIRLTVE
jgi:hypothetical protein